ncbi:MAG TPA: hydrogenase maturation nickel metallochaperone HypA [Methanomassiliicoccales archaeon]|nr:hydrogenase maturation nickel metallochaperone HypA [Methanomassiliicoccales archaeon]HNX48090.1 hydrogenase maturation nickel metallochaperone HypA [Methanomassiliicoccales archaeon]HPR98930.1 hydrogenase maturation nickel metallochaperone HypA [Methanomassiliicoccales archaeon]
MHEVSVMAGIVESVLKELEKHEVLRVEEVLLSLGELTFLGEEQLQFAYEIITRDTPLEGSTLVIQPEETELQCLSCGYVGKADKVGEEFHMSMPSLACPRCKGKVKVLKGQSCRVTSMKVVQE